jgi:transcription antitermination factor NusG
MTELVFATDHDVRVNFGVFAGRNATHAEIDELARSLRGEAGTFAIVAEERHEFGGDVEVTVRQIVIELPAGHAERVLEIAERWARDCIHTRSELGELGSEL